MRPSRIFALLLVVGLIGVGCDGDDGSSIAPFGDPDLGGVDPGSDAEADASGSDAGCEEGTERPCGSDQGECQQGAEVCEQGSWSECRGGVGPVDEVCDGLDNNCDGETDEGDVCQCVPDAVEPCGEDAGECVAGERTCVDGVWGECVGAVGPVDETCDGLDNDCDGDTDEDVPEAEQLCGDTEGECEPGLTACVEGEIVCEGAVVAGEEVCDGLDNNCDGATDETFPEDGDACGSDEGECQMGLTACEDGELTCVGEVPAIPEACDGLDNDCNGVPDDVEGGCECTLGSVEGCGSDEGECVSGERACFDGIWGPCEGAVGPTDEICDGLDNDCDGLIDQAFPNQGAPCGTDDGECVAGTTACVQGQVVCDGEQGPVPEVCDGLDNDCDGTPDQGNPEGGEACGSAEGECVEGILVCTQGQLRCAGETAAVEEACDGLDNDCDGLTDEEDPGGGAACGSDEGECSQGRLTCSRGALVCAGEAVAGTEICDGLDNDCDGTVDEEFPGQGAVCGSDVGTCRTGLQACARGEIVCAAEVGPVEESCDGLDNDCNGRDDDLPGGCACLAGDSELCGSDQGTCERGIRQCTKDGVWGACEGSVGPAPELCDGLDNDCDGELDEEFPGQDDECGTDVGECRLGRAACRGGEVVCAERVGPAPEICDGLDNDCDGAVDEGNPEGGRTCGSDVGQCREGLLVCSAGELVCAGGVAPGDEVCDGTDNDCDGAVDEDNPGGGGACGTDQGLCELGRLTCSRGELVCAGGVRPVDELCDGADNDCDGRIDDDFVGEGQACGSNEGTCRRGALACVDGRTVCEGGVEPDVELCDGLDNDCNSVVDDVEGGCDCVAGDSELCGTDTGACERGLRRCTADGVWGPCEDGVGPTREVCDGVDNDCNGETDEVFPGAGDTCGTDEGECQQGTLACEQGDVVCAGEGLPTPERCDGLDNDCDGAIDQGNPGGGGVCGSDTGECVQGLLVCSDGALVCAGERVPRDEICDGLDNDCDGTADEDPTDVGGECGTDVGECTFGAEVCRAGRLVCDGGVGPRREACDGLDNDCNGRTDEEFPGMGLECGTDVGECRTGLQACVDGEPVCQGGVDPTVELCDSLDNDCDGEIDDVEGGCDCVAGESELCGSDTGECQRGIRRCTDAGVWGACEGGVEPTDELCDGLDNDCDGLADEEFPGQGDACGTDEGECQQGQLACLNAQTVCRGEVGPVHDLCDGLDNDCDGEVDNGGDAWCVEELGANYLCEQGACQYDCPVDAYEENDDLQSAHPLDEPGELDAVVCIGDDDTFAIEGCALGEGTLRVRVDFEGGVDPDLDLELYGPDGELLRSSRGSENSESILVEDLRAGPHTLRVFLFAGEEVPYRLSWERSCPECLGDEHCGESEFCDAGVCVNAWGTCRLPLPLVFDADGHAEAEGDTIAGQAEQRGSCGGRGPEQVYRLQVERPSLVDLRLAGAEGWDTVLHVRADACVGGAEVVCNDDCREVGPSCALGLPLEPGVDYFVFADGFSAQGAGPFQLVADLRPICADNSECAEGQLCELEPGTCEGRGACLARPLGCDDELAPVCGCDGNTYPNDCERQVAGVALRYDGECVPECVDEDRDGYGRGDGCLGPDCNDRDPDVNPEAQELCDGVDNDCSPRSADGADELWIGGACDGPDSDECLEGVLECAGGERACTDETADDVEYCDGEDNDCDGVADNDPVDVGGRCGLDVGECAYGAEECEGGRLVCVGGVDPVHEICNGLDDDCDGVADNGGNAWCAEAVGPGWVCELGACVYDCPTDDFEDNDSVAEAYPLREPGELEAVVCVGDEDYYAMRVCEHGSLNVDVAFDGGEDPDIDLALIGLDGEVVARSLGTTSEEHIEMTDLPAGVYTLRVYVHAGVEARYRLRWTLSCPECVGDDDCPEGFFCQDPGVCVAARGTCRAPVPLSFDATGLALVRGDTSNAVTEQAGSCVGRGPELVYAFEVAEPALAAINMEGGWDTGLYLRAGDCTAAEREVACDDDCDGAVGTSCLRTVPLEAGVPYFVFADGFSGDSAGAFELSVQLLTPCRGVGDCTRSELCEKQPGDCEGDGFCLTRPAACPDIIEPVCGCNGTTYGNDCLRQQAGTPLDYAGACQVACVDADGDGYGLGDECLGPDCDDTNNQVYPGQPELCDGLDNDCDRRTPDGRGEDWYGQGCDGRDTDLCAEGTFQCLAGNRSCSDVSDDNRELCNGEDDDCNPETPDGAHERWLGDDCDGPDADLCAEGVLACRLGAPLCTDDTADNPELCDGRDNDCNPDTEDGVAEPWFGRACDGDDADLCREGALGCVGGEAACSDLTRDNREICNGEDDDCNPDTEDGADEPWLGDACDGDDADLCLEGEQLCVDGQQACSDQTRDNIEICNGEDDDCDERVDNGADRWCAEQVGDGFVCVDAACVYDCPVDEFEDNDDRRQAHLLAEPAGVLDAVVCRGDQDFYRLSVCAGGSVQAIMAYAATEGVRPELQLLDSNGELVQAGRGEPGELSLAAAELPQGDYFLRVFMAEGNEQAYELLWDLYCPECLSDEDCAADSFCFEETCQALAGTCRQPVRLAFDDSGLAVAQGDTSEGIAEQRGDCVGAGAEIVYSFRLAEPAVADVRLVGQGRWDTGLYLRRGDCWEPRAQVACNDDCGGVIGESCINTVALQAGEYFVYADAWAEDGAGPFTLTVQLYTPCQQQNECLRSELCERPAGTCEGDGFCLSRPAECPPEEAPVCGCDGTTYANDCERQQAGAGLDYVGACQVQCLDNDGDGYGRGADCLGPDCNDNDPDIFPGQPELCDGADNDCDPATEDGTGEVWLGDRCDGPDTDLCEEGGLECVQGQRECGDRTRNNLDLCDGADNDCNPETPDGEHELWYGEACDGGDGDLCNEGTFGCARAQQVCSDLTGDNLDLCNGRDDDCNPDTPDGAHEDWLGVQCDGEDTDLCNEGTFQCALGERACTDETGNNRELCNGRDDDCNPDTPDGAGERWFQTLCDGDDRDLCNEGRNECLAGQQVCTDETASNLELCNGRDDDCNPDTPDGAHEEWMGAECDGQDQDLCPEGVFSCRNGSQSCSDASGDNVEICNAQDDDCDEAIDEGASAWCAETAGPNFVCVAGECVYDCPRDEYEENDSLRGAHPLGRPGQLDAVVCANDVDFYAVQVCELGDLGVGIQFNPLLPSSPDIELLNAQGEVIATSEGGPGALGILREDLRQGAYFFRVFMRRGNEATYNLTWSLTCPGCLDDGDCGVGEFCNDQNECTPFPAPAVEAIDPSEGPTWGGEVVTITGAGFRDGAQVFFGALPAADVTVVDEASILAVTPRVPLPGGTVDVVVANPGEQLGVLRDGYTFVPLADWWNLQWPEQITITLGDPTGFVFGRVYIGGVTDLPEAAPGLRAELGRGPDGTAPSSRGWSWTPARYNLDVVCGRERVCDEYMAQFTPTVAGRMDYAFRYTLDDGAHWFYGDLNGSDDGYDAANAGDLLVEPVVVPPPTVLAAEPELGPTSGDQAVIIRGASFQEGAQVFFGDREAPEVVVDSAEALIALTPRFPLPGGLVAVRVVNPDGQSGSLADGYRFYPVTDWHNLQWPREQTVVLGDSTELIYGRVFIEGVTERAGATADLQAEIGMGPDGSRPDQARWIWAPAAFNLDVACDGHGVCDEFMARVVPEAAGVYDYAFRYTLDGGAHWAYGDLNGSDDGYDPANAGSLTVREPVIPPPVVDGIDPAQGPTTGDELVAITGSAFQDGARVLFGEVEAAEVAFDSAELILATTPRAPLPGGPVDVVVINPDGQRGALEQGYTYVPVPDWYNLQWPPEIRISLGENTGDIFGRVFIQNVTEREGATPDLQAQIGWGGDGTLPWVTRWTWQDARFNLDARCVQGVCDEFMARFVPVAEGRYDYALRYTLDGGAHWFYGDLDGSGDGYSAEQAGDLIVDPGQLPAPAVEAVDPTSGPTWGGEIIEIRGAGFQEGAQVHFGDLAAAEVAFDSPVLLLAETPRVPLPGGAVDVIVTNPDEQTGVLPDGYTFFPIPDWWNLQWPRTLSVVQGETTDTIYGRVFIEGLTREAGATPGLLAQVGFGGDGGSPWVARWEWHDARFNLDADCQQGVCDEFSAQLTPAVAGRFDYAFRYSLDGGAHWLYGDLDGSDNGYAPEVAGDLLVEPLVVPPPVIEAVRPNEAPVQGGEIVEILGAAFQDGATVFFGDHEAAEVAFDGPGVLFAQTPRVPLPGGTVALIVRNPDGQTAALERGFTFVPQPDWANLQWPLELELELGQTSEPVFGRVLIDGVTVERGATPGLLAEVGWGTDGTLPWDGEWTWVPAEFNLDVLCGEGVVGTCDEFMGRITPESVGLFGYAFRYSLDAGRHWLYADLDGTGNGYSTDEAGVLLVEPPAQARPLVLSEVLVNPEGVDSSQEWVELYNPNPFAVDLSAFSLGNGGTDYTYSLFQLDGEIPAGGCWVVGGPDSLENNYFPRFAGGMDKDFDPDFQNGGRGTADGVALFAVPAAGVTSELLPLDAVLYNGANTSGLPDERGFPGAVDLDLLASGASAERVSAHGWAEQGAPTPNDCTPFICNNGWQDPGEEGVDCGRLCGTVCR